MCATYSRMHHCEAHKGGLHVIAVPYFGHAATSMPLHGFLHSQTCELTLQAQSQVAQTARRKPGWEGTCDTANAGGTTGPCLVHKPLKDALLCNGNQSCKYCAIAVVVSISNAIQR